MLTRIGQRFDKPWVCIRDFNEVLSVNEKEGGGVQIDLVDKMQIFSNA